MTNKLNNVPSLTAITPSASKPVYSQARQVSGVKPLGTGYQPLSVRTITTTQSSGTVSFRCAPKNVKINGESTGA